MAATIAFASTVVGLGTSSLCTLSRLPSKQTSLTSGFLKSSITSRNPLRIAQASGGRFTCYRTISSGSDEDSGASHRIPDGSAMISHDASAHSGPSRPRQVSTLDTPLPLDDPQMSAEVRCVVCQRVCDLRLRPVPGNPLRMAYFCPLPRGGHGFVSWAEDPRVTLYRIKRAVVQRTDYLKKRLDSAEAIMAVDRERMSRLEGLKFVVENLEVFQPSAPARFSFYFSFSLEVG